MLLLVRGEHLIDEPVTCQMLPPIHVAKLRLLPLEREQALWLTSRVFERGDIICQLSEKGLLDGS